MKPEAWSRGLAICAVLLSACATSGNLRAPQLGQTQEGLASWYGPHHQGRPTASGEPFNMYALTAAHKELPLQTWVKVENLRNGRTVVVRINDRGPYAAGRIIDLSYAAAKLLDMITAGVVPVRLSVVALRR